MTVSRRNFLSSSGLSLAGLASLTVLPSAAWAAAIPRIPQAPGPIGGKQGPKEKL
ncbi:MAG: twin-arginine translocation signal domain-containing protein, partial [Proteobacteria bacterium]